MAVSPVEERKKLDPRIEWLLLLILEARRVRKRRGSALAKAEA